ncbi:polyprenyl synthetase family protein [Aureimonas leprariae]|uniref:Probable farnesyl diphosphate synthase n=1 Tax=Plantimonas leprariae TaxID=2615207 RepID=A0A7V7U1R5_9HYPH|nr:polyprenyl synthetase family protein [Aureimonas leprariae]KAB0682568.1 polyprenyl synthetase family protein [Aureimonas leprariae]
MTSDPKAGFEAALRRIDERLEALLPPTLASHAPLGDALRESVLAPGKRLRPLMTLLAAEDLGGSAAAALDAGCAVEMVHAASLVLDDLPCMDDATLRRGQPALHVRHGEDVAVLVAIGSLAGAYQLIAGIDGLSAEARVEAVAILSAAVGVRGLVGGQFEDLRGGRHRRAVAEIAAANGLKTGSLFSAAVEIGGVVAGASGGVRAELRGFAEELGHAFQLVDDLLDRAPSSSALGKDVGQDRNKSTIVSMMGPAAARRRIERHVSRAEASLTRVFGPSSRMHGLLALVFEHAMRQGQGEGRPHRVDGFAAEAPQEIGAR